MLVEFSVENYLSFKDKVTLSMVASKDNSLPDNVIKSAQGTKLDLLKSAAIYGANASGKSNLVKALRFMRSFVLESSKETQIGSKIEVIPFKLDAANKSKPSEFEIIFLHEGVRYQYGFSVDHERVHEEWLYSYPKNQRRVLFERKLTLKSDKPDIKFRSYWKGERERLVGITRPNALFISVAAQFNDEIAMKVVEWFLIKILVETWVPMPFPNYMSLPGFTEDLTKNYKEIYLQLLKEADLGITDFVIEKMPIKNLIKLLRKPGQPTEVDKLTGTENVPDFSVTQAKLSHSGISEDGKEIKVPFEISEESDGTKRFLELSTMLLGAIIMYPHTLIMDEFDIRLHPILAKNLVLIIHSIKRNDAPQLIFTTHDSSLLDKEFFRRDQIWFTEKNPKGATDLYSLWDFKPRKEENYSKGYLAGRYGAIPFIGNMLDIFK